uniref:hypothetical protein n=1 Tax=Amycolatopsis sp. CA-096443 TaxID=3239919 RepID=UPI003F49973E
MTVADVFRTGKGSCELLLPTAVDALTGDQVDPVVTTPAAETGKNARRPACSA